MIKVGLGYIIKCEDKRLLNFVSFQKRVKKDKNHLKLLIFESIKCIQQCEYSIPNFSNLNIFTILAT